jgi:hypothetical protein
MDQRKHKNVMNIELRYWIKLFFGIFLFCNIFFGLFILITKIAIIFYLIYAISYFILKDDMHKSIPELYRNFKNKIKI